MRIMFNTKKITRKHLFIIQSFENFLLSPIRDIYRLYYAAVILAGVFWHGYVCLPGQEGFKTNEMRKPASSTRKLAPELSVGWLNVPIVG